MQDEDLLAYVTAAARLVAVPLDATRAQAVAVHLARTAALARALESAGLTSEDEPAEVFCPAPFPDRDGAS